MQRIKDEMDSFFRTKAVRTVTVPAHGKIAQVEAELKDPKKIERMWLLVNYLYRVYPYYRTRDREISGRIYKAWETPVFATLRRELLGARYEKEIMASLDKNGVVVKIKRHVFTPEMRLPAVYQMNQDVYRAPNKSVVLQSESAINAITQWLTQRQKPFSPLDRYIINNHHKALTQAIDGITYARVYRRQDRLESEADKKAMRKPFDPVEWRRSFIERCRQIDDFNTIKSTHKWVLCRRDDFGHRLHTLVTRIDHRLRQHTRINGLVPIFEIDMTSAQPTILAALMPAGTDPAYVDCINSGRLYETYSDIRGLGWSRETAKEFVFGALFGSADSCEMKNLSRVFGGFADWLKRNKSEVREEYQDLTDYKPSVNNCADAQRAESKWARSVWGDLIDIGYTPRYNRAFLPIHDSVIVYGLPTLSKDDRDDMAYEVEHTMSNLFFTAFGRRDIKPKFKTTRYDQNQ